MSFHATATVLDALKLRLEGIPLVIGDTGGEKLFQLVAYYRASDIASAFEQLYITKNRICLIVPVNFRHTNDRERNRLFTTRELTVDLLIGDRSFDKAANAALVGGENNVGVIEMTERIIDDLFDTPLALDDVAVEPDEGAPLIVTSDAKPNDPGRVCWVQTLRLRAGLRRCAVT